MVKFSGGSDGSAIVEAAGAYSDSKSTVRERDSDDVWFWLIWDSRLDPVKATYSGASEGGCSEVGAGMESRAGALASDIELTANLFASDGNNGQDPSNVSGKIESISLWEFHEFGNNSKPLGNSIVSEVGTFAGTVSKGTVSQGSWSGFFFNQPIEVDVQYVDSILEDVPAYVLGAYGFEHADATTQRAFLGHCGLANPEYSSQGNLQAKDSISGMASYPLRILSWHDPAADNPAGSFEAGFP